MPIWRPKQNENQTQYTVGTQNPTEYKQNQTSSLDKFISHFDSEHPAASFEGDDLASPYGQVPGNQVAIPPKYIPPTTQISTPILPGQDSVPQSAMRDSENILNQSPNLDKAHVERLVDLGYLDLISWYENLCLNNPKAARQFEELTTLATSKLLNKQSQHFNDNEANGRCLRPKRTITDADFGEGKGKLVDVAGVLSDQVFDKLVTTIVKHTGVLPPLGVNQKPEIIYMGRLIALNGVSPDINIYQEFLSEIIELQKESNNDGNVEELIIANKPSKFGLIRKIRERRISAFSKYSSDNIRKNREGFIPLFGELIQNSFYGFEVRIDVRPFLHESISNKLDREAEARFLWLVSENQLSNKKKKTEVTVNKFEPKDSLGRSPIALITSVELETPSGNIINYGYPALEYPKSENTCLVLTSKKQKNSDLILVENFNLLYGYLKPMNLDQVLGYLEI